MKAAELSIDQALPDDYTQRLPVYKELPDKDLELVSQDMDKVVEKCAKVVRKNSIRKRGKEYTKWIDDCYFLMGKAFYYKRENAKAFKMLNQAAKKYPNEEAKYDARLWLARLYAREENYQKSLSLLSLLENEKELPERLRLDISKQYTSIYLAQENYEAALLELKRAISFAKKKPERMRLTYLLGQLQKEEGERQESMKTFELVLKMHPEYRMEFYTRIQMAMAYSSETGGAEGVRKELMKMLKDEKYIEFRDQIYYALAEMSYSEHDIETTIDYLNLSTQVSQGNDKQKALSFLKLGQIYFKQPEYQLAQANYDSCVVYMPEDFPDAESIRNLSNNLKDLVAQIMIIENEDSLQMVAKLSPDEREDLIADIIQNRIEEEERKIAEERAKTEAAAGALATVQGSPAAAGGFGGGASFGSVNKFYFYNPTTREAGVTEFKRLWGQRKNEDDWRRSSKEESFAEDPSAEGQNGEPDFVVTENGDTLQLSGDWLDPNFYLKDLPLTEEAVEKSNQRIIEAYYTLAIIYKEQMEDVPMSISTLLELNNRFTPNAHTVDSYYRLYRMYLDEGDMAASNIYKNKILNEFPDSQYAKVIKDPDFLKNENADFIAATKQYEKTYIKYYERGYYEQTIRSCDEIISKYGHTQIKPKALLLRALAIGHEQGEAALRAELKKIASNYGDNEYGIKAQQLLNGLDIKKQEQLAREEAEKQAELTAKMADEMEYEYDPNSMHNFVILIHASGKKLSEIKRTIGDFNRTNYKSSALKMSAVVYTNGVQMITIKSFKTAKSAASYATAFENNSALQNIIAENPDYFIVSFTNYALFYKAKDHVNYKIWSQVKYKNL